MGRAKHIAKWVGFGLGGLLAVSVAALALAYAYAQTAEGRAWIAERLGRLLSEPGRIEVTVEGLSGRLPQAPRIAELRARDPRGTWLRVSEVELDWHPLALVTGTLHVSRFEIQRIEIERPPESRPEPEDDAAAAGLGPLPVELLLERLNLAEVTLGEAVLGAAATFRVEAQAASDGTDALTAWLRVARSDDVPGRIEAEARYDLPAQHLRLDVTASEPAGGLIVRALGITGLPAVDVRLSGDGPVDAWDGRLTLALAGLARLEAELGLVYRTDLGFRISGRAESERPFAELPWLLVSGATTFGVDGRWRQAAILEIERAWLESEAVDLVLAGRLDSGSLALDAEARAQVKDHGILASLAEGTELEDLSLTAVVKGPLGAPDLRLRGSARRLLLPGVETGELTVTAETSGPLLQPKVRLSAEIARVETAGAAAERVSAEMQFTPEVPLDQEPLSGRIVASGLVEPFRIEDASDWQPALGQRLAWRFDGRADLGVGEITADRLSVETDTLQVAGSARYALKTGSGRADLEAVYPDLGALGALVGTQMVGRARLAARLDVGSFGEVLGAELSGELQDIVLGDPVIESLLAGQSRIAAKVTLGPAEGLSVRGLAVESAAASLVGDALLGPDLQRLEAGYTVEVKDISGLGAALGQTLSGSARVEGRAEGMLDSLGLSGKLTVAQAALAGRRLGELRLDYLARNVPRQPAGGLQATLSGPVGEFRAQTRYLFDGSALDLSELSLEGMRTELRGRGRIPADGGPVSADLSVKTETLEPWLAFADVAAAGRGRAQIQLTPEGSRQAAKLDAAFEELAIRLDDGKTLSVRELTARLESADLMSERRGRAALAAQDLALDKLTLLTVRAEAAGGPAGGTLNLSAAGEWYGELRLQTEGRVSLSPDALAVQVSRLDGLLLGRRTALHKPLRITRHETGWQVADLELSYGDARLSGAARIGPKRLSADLSAEDFPIAALEPFLPARTGSGLVDARIRIDGPPTALTGQLSLSASELKLAALEDGPVLGLTMDGDWQAGRLSVTGRLSGLSEEDAVLSAALPLRLDSTSLMPSVPPSEALSGRLTWQGPVAPIWDLAPVSGHTFAGMAKISLEVSGTLAGPRMSGQLTIREGEYENLELGTLLRDLELSIELDGERATLTTLTARDGGSGSLSAAGRIELLPERGFPMDLSAAIEKFHVLRRDDVTASASGRLELEGTVGSAALSGRFETDGVEVRIPDRLPADIVDLEAVEEGAALTVAAQPADTAKDRGFELPLDLTVEMPRRVFLRGRGLDSEWAGTLTVAGTAAQPDVKGKLEMVRGQVAVFGKTFKFAHGRVDFPGGETVDPIIDMKAEHAGKDLSVIVQVTGRASDPQIALSSTPELPNDEIVSRLLFGKATTQLTAFEAAQLATTAAELSGGGVSGGMLEGVRNLLGVDVLRVETIGEGEAASTGIAAGAYVTEEIYVEATQGMAADSGTIEVEVEVSPHIFIGSEVEQTGDSNVGIKFKWDY